MFFKQLTENIDMKNPDALDAKELKLRAESPANKNKKYIPRLPNNVNISRLKGDGSEEVPNDIAEGLDNRRHIRRQTIAAMEQKKEIEML